jgi:hypothetical protein
MTSFAIPAPVAPVPLAPADGPRTTQAVPPELGTRAVTATPSGGSLRNDPGPPRLPAPLKGLGIPPLNTRQVGDFDKLDDPPPPAGLALGDRLADLESLPATGLDLRR